MPCPCRAAIGLGSRWCSSACRSRASRCSSASCHALKPLVVVRVRLLCSAAGAAAFRLACCCSVVPGGKTRKLAHDDPLEIQHDDHCWPPEASAMCFDDIRVRAWRLRGCSRAPRVMSRGGGHGADASQLAAEASSTRASFPPPSGGASQPAIVFLCSIDILGNSTLVGCCSCCSVCPRRELCFLTAPYSFLISFSMTTYFFLTSFSTCRIDSLEALRSLHGHHVH